MNPSPRKKAKAQLAPASLAACRLWRRSSRIGVAYSGKANVFAKAAITNTLEAMLQAQRRERHHTQFHVSQRPRQPRLTDALITHGDPITPRQTEFLARCGINPAILKGKGHACHVIDRIMQRRAAGLATYKKVRTLRKFGVPAPHLTSFNRASAILDLLFSERSSRGTRYA